MISLTPEEKKVILFLLCLAFCGLAMSNLIKINSKIEKAIYPQVHLTKVDLNKVSLGELVRLRCVSEKLARRIIEHRDFHQEFASLEELKDIKGIGEYRYERLKEVFFVQ
ncbi:MAG: helix-hairpin-helix domain-containing protein [Candidatus Omnitrophica bacterium]|jgi:competence ComEA-like helix-hairpin-helix protein|nr:helix-hairpin-helix domain-containing protein [Candidatus Omnitrophota bacterium]